MGEATRARGGWATGAIERARELERWRAAHELKNPLSAVKALVQLGLRNPAERAAHQRLAAIEREVARMQDILKSFFSSAHPLREAAPERVHLGALVSNALLALAARADEACVRLSARGDACLDGDPRRLEEALLYLVANGIEATPAGGEVSVEVRSASDVIEIVVRDTGCGMPPETLGRIGTPFFTTRRSGTGLGVALARSVIAEHGGSLRYESASGAGTTVRATLPRERARDASSPAEPARVVGR